MGAILWLLAAAAGAGVDGARRQAAAHSLDAGICRPAGSAGAGMVEITINGKMEVQSIHIAQEVVDPNDISTLEVLIASAFNAAVQEIQELLKSEATSLAGGMPV